nr:pituitary tumor-transforming gene 1 protein-interacting protein isoform X1 [Zonotrichia albicollis]
MPTLSAFGHSSSLQELGHQQPAHLALKDTKNTAGRTKLSEQMDDCHQYTNRSCEECLKNVTCLWCASSRRCMEYPVRRILPPADLCELRSARWGVCWVNFEALIIAMSVVGGTLLIMLGVCCCCCCCKKKSKKKPDKDDERAAREREKRRVRQEERRAEMKSRHDEIRRKYGLFKEENPYAKFEN